MIERGTLRALCAALLCTLLSALLWAGTVKETNVFRGDTPGYLLPAFNLYAHGVFSSERAAAREPGGGREPGYPWLLAGLMALDPEFGRFTTDCLEPATACPAATYRSAQWANGILVALTGLAVYLAAWLLTGRALPAFAAGGMIWLNNELAKARDDLMSDHLALLLLALAMAAAAWASRRGRVTEWALAGALLGLAALTKAIFLYLFLAAAALGLIALAVARDGRRRLAIGLLGLALGSAPVAGSWMARNAAVTGDFAITADDRAGISLHVRNEYNRMSPQQYAAAFVHWTRGFGDSLAKRLFDREVLSDFSYSEPGSFMHEGHLYSTRVRERMARDGLSQEAAEAALDAEVRDAILASLPLHAATTLPLFYRGLWIDEFIAFTFPALLWLTWTALRRRRWAILIVLSGGWFSLLFYPLVSLNITRYQVTAVPALALAGGIAAAALYDRLRARLRAGERAMGILD